MLLLRWAQPAIGARHLSDRSMGRPVLTFFVHLDCLPWLSLRVHLVGYATCVAYQH